MVSLTREFQNKDDAYCFSLAKTLYCVSTPVTVGFYAPWGHCKSFLLNRIQEYMHLQSLKKDQQEFQKTGMKQRGTSGWDLVSIVFLMIFYRPVLSLQQKQRKNVQHLFIHFSAWEYAGSDQLWAGLITALCDGIEGHFGLVPVSVYRAMGRKCGIVQAPLDKEWVSKKFLCLPLWAAVLLVSGVAIGVAALILIFGIPVGDASGDAIALVEGVGATAVGITAAAAIRMVVMVIRNAVITQKGQLERQMNRTDLSAQLGFMSNVKREVRVVTRFLQFMEIFQRRKLRVVLVISSLDQCSPDKVVGVLDAMNILLSDYEAPFISILAVDPRVIVDCVESSLYMKGMANNGYEFLNRIITLPFSVPKMDCNTKMQLIRNIVDWREELEKSFEDEEEPGADSQQRNQQANQAGLVSGSTLCPCGDAGHHEAPRWRKDDAELPLVVTAPGREQPPRGRCGKGFKAKDLIQQALDFLLDESMKEYMTDNVVQMKRIINAISVTVRLMATEVPWEQLCPQKVVAWVILANQWPCRLSWILQCIEDDEQICRLGLGRECRLAPGLSLWEVYKKYMEELDMIKGQLEKLLELDGDPELFQSFLCGRFRVEDANFFLPFTVNLDTSLKRHMELLRGSRSLKQTEKPQGLSKCTLLRMSVEDICREMDKLGLKEENTQRYKERLKEHHLSGRALVYSERNEIKEALGMSLDRRTNEDIYCEALAETLHHVAIPVAVGFYAPWGQNKRGLLDKIEEGMTSRSKEKEDENGGGRNGISLLSFIWRVIFYQPLFSSVSSERVRYIFINFNAWEYVGCDRTWAGLVTTLLDEIEEKNKILFSFVRAFGEEPSEESAPQGKKWVFKKWSKIFYCFLCVYIGLALFIVLMRKCTETTAWKSIEYMIVAVSTAISGLPFILVLKNLLFTMKRKLQKEMDRKDLSAQLGFMHTAKEEVKTTINFLRLMAFKEGREVRVVLKITCLDLCTPDKVVGVLDAINILLCDGKAPFISILAADPSILVECIQWSNNTWSNGYLYLDRIVSLPFSLPQMSQMTKSQFLKKILKNQPNASCTINPGKDPYAKNGKKKARLLTRKDIERISCYLCNNNFDAYFPGNSIQMKRVVNTVLTMLTMVKMGFQPKAAGHTIKGKGEEVDKETIEEIIDWVVLANCWPCRLSWILQCEEDYRQRRSLEEGHGRTFQGRERTAERHQQGGIAERDGKGILEVYEDNVWELDKIKYNIRKLLELDGDPELFRIFLQKSHFTVGRARYFSDLLINLNFSLKRQFELLRGLNGIRTNKDESPPTEKH